MCTIIEEPINGTVLAEDPTHQVSCEEVQFCKLLSAFLHLAQAIASMCAFTGKGESASMQQTQQSLCSARACIMQHGTEFSDQMISMEALLKYMTALYAISVNDVHAADNLLAQAIDQLAKCQQGALYPKARPVLQAR